MTYHALIDTQNPQPCKGVLGSSLNISDISLF